MRSDKYNCDFCDIEVLPTKDKDNETLLELWDIGISRVSPENQSLRQHFHGDIHEGMSGQICKSCLIKYPKIKSIVDKEDQVLSPSKIIDEEYWNDSNAHIRWSLLIEVGFRGGQIDDAINLSWYDLPGDMRNGLLELNEKRRSRNV